MKKTRITCDTEIPIPTSNGNKLNHCSGTHHDYSLPHGIIITTDNDKQYDKPQKEDDLPIEIIDSTQGPAIKCIRNNQSSNKCYSGIRNYDVPKDTINSNILERLSFSFFFAFHLI